MTIAQFILFLMKYNLQEIVELVQARQDKHGLVLRFRGLPVNEAIEEQDRQFLSGLRVAI